MTLNGTLTVGNDTHTVNIKSFGTHDGKNATTASDDEARFATGSGTRRRGIPSRHRSFTTKSGPTVSH